MKGGASAWSAVKRSVCSDVPAKYLTKAAKESCASAREAVAGQNASVLQSSGLLRVSPDASTP